jgi:hypothetical protein
MTRNNAAFAEGHGMPENMAVLGVSKPVNANAHQDAIYGSEYAWHDEDSAANKLLNLKQARKFSMSVINHPALDNLPNIDDVRKNFSEKNVLFNKKLTMRDEQGIRGQRIGMMADDEPTPNGKYNIMINPKVTGTTIRQGELTHELTHTILHNAEAGTHPGHNWAFAKLHTHIVRNVLGAASARVLEKHYKNNGVNFDGT